MEKDVKQQSVTYNKGITNQPSYVLTDDGELSDCVGLTTEDGELKPIQSPVFFITSVKDQGSSTLLSEKPKILCVHKSNNQERLICARRTNHYGSYSNVLYWGTVSDGVYTLLGTLPASTGGAFAYNDGAKITTVGNSVVVSDDNGITYFLWKGDSYIHLGKKLPEPTVDLCLGDDAVEEKDEFSLEGMVYQEGFLYKITFGQNNAYNDAIVGGFNKVLRSLHQKKAFAFPVVARTAVELYDGSYVLHSSPIILFPLFNATTIAYLNSSPFRFSLMLPGRKIFYKMTANFSGWEDIIKNVVLFVSREIPVFDTTKEAVLEMMNSVTTPDGWYIAGSQSTMGYYQKPTTYSGGDKYNVLQAVPASEVESNIAETSVFFKLCELGVNGTNNEWRDTSGLIKTNTIENIDTQPQLSSDDFHSHCNLSAEYMYAYNNRLHLSNVSRSLFDGFTNFMPYNTEDSYAYTIYTYIRTESGDKIVSNSFSTNQSMGYYYFYPDPRAYKATIFINDNTKVKDMTLKEHPSLNGAYYFDFSGLSLTSGYAPAPSGSYSEAPETDDYKSELLGNVLMVSEADNPFTFLPKGYVSVGNGMILGVAAVTMALSEYQHGNQPLVVFTTDGVWSLTVMSDGYYSKSQAVSREVCNNPDSITQVDNGIFFSSQKGLMYLDTSGVKCVSAQMRGTDFDKFIDSCIMAYDYRDSLIYIVQKNSNIQFCYIYNMKSGTFSKKDFTFQSVVNNYPDTIIQVQDGDSWDVYSLINKPDEQDDPGTGSLGTYSATFVTRPIKFGNLLTLKSIRQIRHIYTTNPNATISLTIEASNNGVNWATLTSLRGKPWRLYRFTINMANLKATDRYAGTIFWIQERRTEKLR